MRSAALSLGISASVAQSTSWATHIVGFNLRRSRPRSGGTAAPVGGCSTAKHRRALRHFHRILNASAATASAAVRKFRAEVSAHRILAGRRVEPEKPPATWDIFERIFASRPWGVTHDPRPQDLPQLLAIGAYGTASEQPEERVSRGRFPLIALCWGYSQEPPVGFDVLLPYWYVWYQS